MDDVNKQSISFPCCKTGKTTSIYDCENYCTEHMDCDMYITMINEDICDN